jgi:hypothetical protein
MNYRNLQNLTKYRRKRKKDQKPPQLRSTKLLIQQVQLYKEVKRIAWA